MERPFKRARLSVFRENASPDVDLEHARYRNDLTLKSRFEHIFNKYSHDFTGIGDEIEVLSGDIVVNNGHLEAMEDEADVGAEILTSHVRDRPGTFTSGALLRAMTVAPENKPVSLADVEDEMVIASIENMAQNAAEAVEGEDMDPDDLLAGGRRSNLSGVPDRSYAESEDDSNLQREEDNDSVSDDSLIGRRETEERSSSPDSLFEENDKSSDTRNSQQAGRDSNSNAFDIDKVTSTPELSDAAILEKFGPRIGRQVLDVLQQRHAVSEAHIDPTWRAPNIGNVFQPVEIDQLPDEPMIERKSPLGMQESVWKLPSSITGPMRRSLLHRSPSQESVDPLQQDFIEDDLVEGEENIDFGAEDVDDGVCPFCRKQLAGKGGVHNHWEYMLRKPREDGIHDMDYIRKRRSHAKRRTRRADLTICDFRVLVKMHEVDGLDFLQISECTLFGGRTEPYGRLYDFYYNHRRKNVEELAVEGRSWKATDDARLLRYCEKEGMTFPKLKRLMDNRSQRDIGNRLATIWMQEFEGNGIDLDGDKTERDHGIGRTKSHALTQQAPTNKASSATDRDSFGLDDEPEAMNSYGEESHFQDWSRFRRSVSASSIDSLFNAAAGAEIDVKSEDSGDEIFRT